MNGSAQSSLDGFVIRKHGPLEGLLRTGASRRQAHRLGPRKTDGSRYRHGCGPPRTSSPDFKSPYQILIRILTLIWLTVWLTTVPLFHIHIPDTTDGWSTLQSGGAHTVFTPDLPGEFAHPLYDSHHFGQLSQRGVNSPELAIALFDEKAKKAKALTIVDAPYRFPDILSRHASQVFACVGLYWKSHLPRALPASRAPPLRMHS